MGQKLLKGALLGAVVLFVWSMLVWTVFPWHKTSMMKFKNEDRVAEVVRENAPMSGIYVLPNMLNMEPNSEAMMTSKDRMRQGPFVFAAVSLQGKDPSMNMMMVKNFILKFIVALIATWLVLQTKLPYNKRVAFITVFGVALALMASMPFWIWFGFSMQFATACIFETIIGWFFAGVAIAKVLK